MYSTECSMKREDWSLPYNAKAGAKFSFLTLKMIGYARFELPRSHPSSTLNGPMLRRVFLLRLAPAKSRAKQTDEEYCHICKIIEFAVFCSLFGKPFILFEAIAGCVAAISGFLMFHWQHIVPANTYRKPSSTYDRVDAALEGSTFLMVPWWLKWMTLGIEYHHVRECPFRSFWESADVEDD